MSKTTLFSDPQELPCANIRWCEGHPTAVEYDDVYGSTDDAIAEKTHVFLAPNNLSQRFSQLSDQAHFSILELGFGGGLNFLLTWQLWRQQRTSSQSSGRLIYTSIEGYPMSMADLQRWQQWPALADLASQLQAQYPLPIKGFHVLHFGDVTLNLVLGPVDEAIKQIQGQADAIYLDGFNPANNAAMWQPAVLQNIARLSRAGTSLGTYSAARVVKDHLVEAGFVVSTQSGYGKKRHQLSGHYVPASSDSSPKQVYQAPWHRPQVEVSKASHIAVIGAGISGCSTALALQQRGYQVQLIEAKSQVADGASGNRQGMLYAKLPDNVTVAGQLHQQGLQYSMGCLVEGLDKLHWQACGLLQLAQSEAELAQMQRLVERQFPAQWLTAVTAEQATAQAGQQLNEGGLLYHQAGWASPPVWCRSLSQQLELAPWLNTTLTALEPSQDQWQLQLQGAHAGAYTFDAVVLCNATAAKQWLPDLALPLKSVRGQVTYLQGANAPLKVVCGEGYVTPAKGESMAVGASYNLHSDNPALAEQDHQGNLGRLHQLLPGSTVASEHICGGRVGFRATTPDYLPMVGQLADAQKLLHHFAHLRKDKNYRFTEAMPWLTGLYINAGHGSKGLITAPLCAQLLAAQMAGEVLPVGRSIAQALHPNRFFLRDMMRRKR
ncbi:MAG: bifunctional tRNA (5-methylaminomethyl-2-thiouridine)(34)-methyltransferase MnmD/FAD-dependent 5-carboxymethylaminomethyl-2-thiouridine(34) oxidoreductase MnmC [Gammaproteobacteria bacterium]|nr:bifunctional tRNA (5-methylaminomethyl-2-thiouridine)(34)-methyltransferase MnmD/FAD-dependent 5-carboxymethylaminomethyl-2-thiouridine(34) oxidoreductase MnmC [Gammaproteobacteria bacterium]